MIKPVALTRATSDVDLSGKAAIVTGGATLVGLGIAAKLAESGASIMLADVDLEATTLAAAELRATGCRVEVVQADASEERDAGRLIRATKDAFSRIDLLVLTSADADAEGQSWIRAADDGRAGAMAPLSRAVARELIDAGTPGKIIVITREVELPEDEEPPQSDASRAAVDVFLANSSGVRVTYSQDPFGNLIEITSNVLNRA